MKSLWRNLLLWQRGSLQQLRDLVHKLSMEEVSSYLFLWESSLNVMYSLERSPMVLHTNFWTRFGVTVTFPSGGMYFHTVLHPVVFLDRSPALSSAEGMPYWRTQPGFSPPSSFLCGYCLFSQNERMLLCSGINEFFQVPSKTSEDQTNN